ncbi:MAG: hypothetical protein JRI23_24240 [Deltaproteobacteria bacterium]|nr:hypothetical protein [Deltaproteobacteria bacterium]MBW2535108.1 hypothetical protein [Deltaproteobacteria bacterium]
MAVGSLRAVGVVGAGIGRCATGAAGAASSCSSAAAAGGGLIVVVETV